MKNLCVGLGVAPLALVFVLLSSWVSEATPAPQSHQVVAQCPQDCPTVEAIPAVPVENSGR